MSDKDNIYKLYIESHTDNVISDDGYDEVFHAMMNIANDGQISESYEGISYCEGQLGRELTAQERQEVETYFQYLDQMKQRAEWDY